MDFYEDLTRDGIGSNWINANGSQTAATATITVADGDAANGMTEKEHITIISTDGTTKDMLSPTQLVMAPPPPAQY